MGIPVIRVLVVRPEVQVVPTDIGGGCFGRRIPLIAVEAIRTDQIHHLVEFLGVGGYANAKFGLDVPDQESVPKNITVIMALVGMTILDEIIRSFLAQRDLVDLTGGGHIRQNQTFHVSGDLHDVGPSQPFPTPRAEGHRTVGSVPSGSSSCHSAPPADAGGVVFRTAVANIIEIQEPQRVSELVRHNPDGTLEGVYPLSRSSLVGDPDGIAGGGRVVGGEVGPRTTPRRQ